MPISPAIVNPAILGPAIVSPAIGRFLARLPADVAASFSAHQLAAIELHFGMRHRVAHAADWRRRFRLPFGDIYIVLLAGADDRGD